MNNARTARPRWRRLVLALAMVAALAVSIGVASASATNGRVLILSTSVSGGASSPEANAAASFGRGVDVVTPSVWGGMTQAQFAAYDAIILGDPNCGFGSDGAPWIGAAAANTGVWSPAVTGNVIVIGSDPVLHGKGQVTINAVKYAIDSATTSGQTGAYISLSCYWHGTAPHTPLHVLDGFGTFTTTGVPGCFNDAHIVASHPALTGLTDAALSNWGCSVHEALDTIDPSFLPLAIARTSGSGALSFPDGSVGIPYVIARGAGLRLISNIDLAPLAATAPVGSHHTVTATVKENSVAVPGLTVTFTVLSGPNAGVSGTGVTDASGNASFSYAGGPLPGTDNISAKYTDSLSRLQVSNTVQMVWTKPLDANLTLTKSVTPGAILDGETAAYTLTATNFGPATATGVVITDTLPAGLAFVPAPGCTAAGQVVTCPVGTLPANSSYVVHVTARATAPGTLTNTATVSGDQPDLSPTDNTASVTTFVAPVADLSVTKTGPASVYWGQTATYTVTVTNNGPDDASGVVVSDLIVGGTATGTGPGGPCVVAAGLATCPVGALASGASAVVTIDVDTTATGSISDTAAVSGAEFDPNVLDNSASASTVVKSHPTALTYTGDTTSNYHDAATLSATLVDVVTGNPLATKAIEFDLGAQSCTDGTSAAGVATCSIVPNQAAGSYPLSASYAGSALFDASSDTGTFKVTLEQTITVYTGATAPVQNLTSLVLSATLKEDGVTPIVGRTVVLSIGSGASTQSCSAVTNAAGAASCSIVISQAAGMQTLAAAFAGDPFYLASGDSSAVRVYSARSIKQDALNTLEALAAPTGKKGKGDDSEDNRYASAARKVAKSLTPAWWNVDGIHLTLNGCGVFDNEKAAASQLRELLKSKKLTAAEKALIQGVIDQLVQADQILATTAVDEATAAGGNAKKLALANKALAKAAALIAAGKPDEAINQYRIAWEKAQESLGRKVCGDDGHEDEDGHDGGHHDNSDD